MSALFAMPSAAIAAGEAREVNQGVKEGALNVNQGVQKGDRTRAAALALLLKPFIDRDQGRGLIGSCMCTALGPCPLYVECMVWPSPFTIRVVHTAFVPIQRERGTARKQERGWSGPLSN